MQVNDLSRLFYTGTVIGVHPKSATCDILRTDGEVLHNVAIANAAGGIFSNGVSWGGDLRGAVVYFGYFYGTPYILGTLPSNMQPKAEISTPLSETTNGSANALTYGNDAFPSFAGGGNTDVQPGDKVISSDGGASISLLSDGSAQLKASPLCQLFLGAGMDFARLVARQLQIFTDFGTLEFSHGSSGRNTLTIKGGAEYSQESQPGLGTHTVFMHLGDTDDAPDVRFGVRVTNTEGTEFGALAMGKDGNLIFTTSKNYLLSVGEDAQTMVEGDIYEEGLKNKFEQIHQSKKIKINKNESKTVAMEKDLLVGKDEKHVTLGTLERVIGKDETHKAMMNKNHIVTSDENRKTGACLNWDVGAEEEHNVAGVLTVSCGGLNLNAAFGAGEAAMSCGNMTIKCDSLDITKS